MLKTLVIPAATCGVPLRRIYDLRHAFATVVLRAGIPTFHLPRYEYQPDHDRRHYGRLARDGREQGICLLDELGAGRRPRWTLRGRRRTL